jgi:predicted alpha/beta superfamily hydrolase
MILPDTFSSGPACAVGISRVHSSLAKLRISYLLLAMTLAAGVGRTGAFAQNSSPATQPSDAGQPVTIPNARQYSLTSKLNGQEYRLMVYVPPKLDQSVPQPVFYVLDGNYYFGTACDAMGMNSLVGIVVGIGYPLEDREEITHRRTFDLSLPNASGSKKYGGADAFLRVVEEEIKPFINARFKIDPARQCLYGHSLGGLTVLRQLFRNPQAYSTYIAASPSIWWNSRAVLGDEEAFSRRARAGELKLRLLLTSAGDEQYHGDDAKQLAKSQTGSRMVDNVTELAARLEKLNPANVKVTREMFPDETHPSGAQASLCRALKFALPALK